MEQPQLLYNYDSITITVVLFTLILLFNEFGFRMGRFVQNHTDENVKTLTSSIQASILGLLALLLGFTFSMSMQRYDNRSQALISEANAIGTVILRTQLLPNNQGQEVSQLLQKYISLRIAVGKIDLTKAEARQTYNLQIVDVQNKLWALAVLATHEDARPVTTGAFITALNEMIDSQGRRNAILQMQVPEVVLLLLFLAFITSGGMLGYSGGLNGNRVIAPTIMMSLLIAMIVFIIIDLDRPKRGLIQVDQSSMLELQQGTSP